MLTTETTITITVRGLVSLVAWTLNQIEARFDLVLIETSLLFFKASSY